MQTCENAEAIYMEWPLVTLQYQVLGRTGNQKRFLGGGVNVWNYNFEVESLRNNKTPL